MISAGARTVGTGSFGCWARRERMVGRRVAMATRNRRTARIRQRRRARLRLWVLRLGGLLGWGSRDVIGFAEALTGRPWRHCGAADLESVQDEFLALRWVIRRKTARRSLLPPNEFALVNRGHQHAT